MAVAWAEGRPVKPRSRWVSGQLDYAGSKMSSSAPQVLAERSSNELSMAWITTPFRVVPPYLLA